MTCKMTPCPVETTLQLISSRWKVLIIRDLLEGTKRFGELRKSIGPVTQKVLTANLRAMEEDGLLTRKVYAEVPPARGIYTYGTGLQPASHSGFHVPLGKGLSANGHPPSPLDKEYSCFYGSSRSTAPSGFIELLSNTVSAGDGNKGQAFTSRRFFT